MTNPASIADSLQRLRRTFDSGKTRPIEWRLQQLAELARMMREHEADFAEALKADLGKCLFEAVLTEMSFVEGEAKFAHKRLARWMRPKRVGTPMMALPGRSYIEPEPKGVVLIIAPWNYPLSMVLAPLAGAIAAGNCAVMKPSEITSNTSAAIARILPRYLDADAFAVIEGGVPETTELLEHAVRPHPLHRQRARRAYRDDRGREAPDARHARTRRQEPVPGRQERGSRGGRYARRLGQVHQRGADLRRTRSRARASRRRDAVRRSARGQDQGVLRRRSERRARTTAASRASATRQRFAQLLQGQNIHTGGQVDVAGRYVSPTIVLDPAPDSALMQEEIFGPVLPVITVDEMHDAIKFVADRPKPLALYLFTKSKALEEAVLGKLSAGSVCINDAVIFMVVARTAVRRHRQQRHGALHAAGTASRRSATCGRS